MENISIENKCCICLENLDLNDNKSYTLDCNHKFHTDCIIDWFRTQDSNGRCPLCNLSENNNDYSYLSWYNRDYVINRFNIIKKYGRKKDAPEKLKKELEKIKNLENESKDFNKQKKEFNKRTDVKEFRKMDKKYNQQSWKNTSKILKQKTKIVAQFPLITGF
tara:strand:+ start:1369 stop:1857 length:489 start_codon:yes stop_codon:yes gene_type:complete